MLSAAISNTYATFEAQFIKKLSNTNAELKKWVVYEKKPAIRLKMQHFNAKLSSQNAMLREVEWGVQNGPITKNGFLPVTTLLVLRILSHYKNILSKFGLMYQLPKCWSSYFS